MTGNTQLANTLDYDFSANSLTFDAGAGSFVVGGTNTLTIGTGGITVLSNNDQAFNANLASAPRAHLRTTAPARFRSAEP